jgi:hypothetical protein
MYNLERNKTNENHENKYKDSHSYIIIKNKNYISSIKDEDNKPNIGSRNGIKDESNNNFYESNVIFNMTDNALNHTHTNEEKKSQKLSESIPAEELFIKQKDKIKHYKEMMEKEKKIVSKNENSKDNEQKEIVEEEKKHITLEDYDLFEIAPFSHNRDYKYKDNRIPIFKEDNWKRLIEPKINIELKNIALRTVNEIDYDKNMAKININFTLKEESELWIFTRSFIKNETINFNNSTITYESDKISNKYSSVIKVIKKRDCLKSFVTFGTFCENNKHSKQISYKSFLKRQLVNFNETNYQQIESDEDSCDFNMYITDKGDDCIDTKISMNEDNKFNQIIAKFYLPTNKRCKLLFCGEGESVIIKSIKISNLDKNDIQEDEFETLFTLEQKSCNCCSIV